MTISKRHNLTTCQFGWQRWGYYFNALDIYTPSTIWELRWPRRWSV